MKLEKKYWIAIACKILVIMTTFLTSIIINRGLGVAQKGEYTYIINLVELLYVLLSVGIGQSYATLKRVEGEKIRGIYSVLGLIHGILILIFGVIITQGFNIKYGLYISMLTSTAVVKVIISMICVVEESVKRNIIITVINCVYLIFLAIFFFLDRVDLRITLIGYFINDLVTIGTLMKVYKLRLCVKKATLDMLKRIYSTGILTMVVMLLISVNYHIDVIMLRHLTSSYYVGLYSVGVTFSNMFLLIPDSFKEVLFGDATKKNFNKDIVRSSIIFSVESSLIILVGFILFGEFVIKWLYGKAYGDAYELTIILFIGSLSMIFFKILQPIYIAYGKQKKAALFLACSAIVNVVLNFALIPKYDCIGAAISTAISYSVCGLLFYIYYSKTVDISDENI